MKTLPFTLLTVLFFWAALCPAQQPELKQYTFTEVHMGTEFRIVFYAADEKIASKAAKAAFARVAELDQIMSDYKKDSELMQLCARAGTGPVKVSKDLFAVLSRSQELARKTDGAFDVTLGPVVKLWRKARKLRELPDPQRLQEALGKVGHKKMELDPVMQTVRLLVGMLLDLGGIAKGYAADEMLAVLRSLGISRALVAASGDIAVSEPPPGKKGWKVAIGDLKDPSATTPHYLLLVNGAVSTSGDLNQYVEIKGVRYSHIVDPKTGIGLIGRSSSTVIAKDCTSSDSLATAVSVLGPEQGLKLIEQTPGAAAFIMREGKDGKLETFFSKRFNHYEYPTEK